MQIAEVYPIQRLPRRFSVFDYLVPEDLKIERGFFVNIPFRNQQILGVVKDLHERFSPRPGLKAILSIKDILPLEEASIKFFEWLAKDLAQGVPAVLNAALPQPGKNKVSNQDNEAALTMKIRATEAPAIQRLLKIIEERRQAFISLPNLPRMAAVVTAFLHLHPQDRIAILVPGVAEAKALTPYFKSFGLSLITGEKSETQRFKAWDGFRQGQTRILLGTHLAALLLPPTTEAIFVFRSGHESHKQWDRNPRYDARDIVKKIQQQNNCRLYFFDTAPRVDDLVFFGQEQIFIEHPEPRPQFIDPKDERPMSAHPIISYTLEAAIKNCLEKGRRVLCFYNRKGKASSIRCADCGQGFPCPKCGGVFTVYETTIKCHHCAQVEPLPFVCPNCHGPNLKERGFGNQTIKQALEKIFPEAKVAMIDKTVQENPAAATIVLATSYYFETYQQPFVYQNFGLVVDLDADLPLLVPGFRSFENAIKQLEDLRGLATREQAVFLAQTKSRNLFEAYYNNPLVCLLDELALRQSYSTPPFTRWLTLKIRDPEERRAELELKTILENLKGLDGVSILPIKYEKGLGCSVSLSVLPAGLPAILDKISELPDRVVIDTNAIS
ncbi:MAG: hypothetical protein V1664_01670 [Candidatus Uhrbacteria bacterium]